VNYEEIRSGAELEASAAIRARVIRARQKQLDRFASSRQMLYTDCEGLCERAMTQQGVSARAHDRILKVARTIDDLEAAANLEPKHIAAAIQYRSLERTYWA